MSPPRRHQNPARSGASVGSDDGPVISLGGGVKLRLYKNIILRGDFRDYLTTFPRRQIVPAANGTARGIFQQFTPLFGVSYTF